MTRAGCRGPTIREPRIQAKGAGITPPNVNVLRKTGPQSQVVKATSLGGGLVEECGEPVGGGVEIESGSGSLVEGVLDALEVGLGVHA